MGVSMLQTKMNGNMLLIKRVPMLQTCCVTSSDKVRQILQAVLVSKFGPSMLCCVGIHHHSKDVLMVPALSCYCTQLSSTCKGALSSASPQHCVPPATLQSTQL